MRPDIYPVATVGRARLCVMAKPVGGEWITDEFRGIAQFGIRRMVSLLEDHEVRSLGLGVTQGLCDEYGMEFIRFPIPDRGVPPEPRTAFALIAHLHQGLENGIETVIHCRAGIGRTGMMAAAILVREDLEVDRAFDMVSKARRVQVPDTPEQRGWVARNALQVRAFIPQA